MVTYKKIVVLLSMLSLISVSVVYGSGGCFGCCNGSNRAVRTPHVAFGAPPVQLQQTFMGLGPVAGVATPEQLAALAREQARLALVVQHQRVVEEQRQAAASSYEVELEKIVRHREREFRGKEVSATQRYQERLVRKKEEKRALTEAGVAAGDSSYSASFAQIGQDPLYDPNPVIMSSEQTESVVVNGEPWKALVRSKMFKNGYVTKDIIRLLEKMDHNKAFKVSRSSTTDVPGVVVDVMPGGAVTVTGARSVATQMQTGSALPSSSSSSSSSHISGAWVPASQFGMRPPTLAHMSVSSSSVPTIKQDVSRAVRGAMMGVLNSSDGSVYSRYRVQPPASEPTPMPVGAKTVEMASSVPAPVTREPHENKNASSLLS